MARLHGRQDKLTITNLLRFAKGAVMKVTNSDGTESTVDLTELGVLDGLTATAAEINAAADSSANCAILTGTATLTAATSGFTYFLNAATGAAVNLPAPALGLRYRFVIGATAPASGAWTIVSDSNATIIQGSVSTAADGAATGIGADEDTITFATSALPGDQVDIVSDGTNWYVHGQGSVAAAITLTDAA